MSAKRLKKLNKREARKLYALGHEIILVGDKVNEYHILGGWRLGCEISRNRTAEQTSDTNYGFDEHVSEFQWYLEPSLGRRAAYYIYE